MTDVPLRPPSPASPASPAVVQAHSPGDVVAVVPYLLGFHPTESLTVLGMVRSRGTRFRTGPVARIDLPPPGLEEAAVGAVLTRLLPVPEVAGALVLVHRSAVDVAAERQDAALLAAVSARCEGADVELLDALRVAEGRWWSLLCTRTGCCPVEGTPVRSPAEPGGPAHVGAVAVLAGLAPLPDRAALEATLAPADDLPARLVLAALPDAITATARLAADAGGPGLAARAVARLGAATRGTDSGPGGLPAAHVSAELLALLETLPGRDAVLVHALGVPDDEAPEVRRLLAHLVRCAPVGAVAPGAAVLAALGLVAGEGALTRIALDRALADDPSYSLAHLLESAADLALRPEEVRAALRGAGRAPAGHSSRPGRRGRRGRRAA